MQQREIIVIDANPNLTKLGKRKRKPRVCAYCRVSTDDTEQLNSFETQVKNYTEVIKNKREWVFAGIFADEGISGRLANKRPEFKKMIGLCRSGKIDIILTKSISRFARNTLECIEFVRELKSLDVKVIFEKESIDTDAMHTELLFSMLSAFAQAESESISRNVAVGIQHNFSLGKFQFQYHNFLGYIKGEDGRPCIVEKDAETIRLIYTSFIDGASLIAIKAKLEEKKMLSPGGKETWTTATIKSILINEKYMGDVLLQKSFTVDFLKGTRRANNGEMTKYLVKHNHVGIVSEEVFLKAQDEMTRRSSKTPATQKETITKRGKHSGKYALTGKVFCGNCGTRYRRFAWSVHGRKEVVWRCISRLEFGRRLCPDSPTIKEAFLHECIMSACKQYMQHTAQQNTCLDEEIISAVDVNSKKAELTENLKFVQKEIDRKNVDLDRLIELISQQDDDTAFLDLRIL